VSGRLVVQVIIFAFLQVYDLLEQIEVCCIDVTAQKKHGKIHPSGKQKSAVLSFDLR
jgi:hypothetical protein